MRNTVPCPHPPFNFKAGRRLTRRRISGPEFGFELSPGPFPMAERSFRPCNGVRSLIRRRRSQMGARMWAIVVFQVLLLRTPDTNWRKEDPFSTRIDFEETPESSGLVQRKSESCAADVVA